MTEEDLAKILRIPDMQVRKLRYAGKIPFLRLSYKSIRFNPDRVREALDRLEVKETA
jgi:hypothetical protein